MLPFGAKTVAETCVEGLRAGGADEIVVVLGHRAEELKGRLKVYEYVRFALNEEAESEMGASIARGVEKVSGDAGAILVALVDQPAVPPSVMKDLIGARARTGAAAVVPEWEGRGGHPVLVDMSFRGELLSLDARGGLRSLFEEHGEEVLRVAAGSPFVARDMDTWDDYCRLHAEVFGRPPRAGAG